MTIRYGISEIRLGLTVALMLCCWACNPAVAQRIERNSITALPAQLIARETQDNDCPLEMSPMSLVIDADLTLGAELGQAGVFNLRRDAESVRDGASILTNSVDLEAIDLNLKGLIHVCEFRGSMEFVDLDLRLTGAINELPIDVPALLGGISYRGEIEPGYFFFKNRSFRRVENPINSKHVYSHGIGQSSYLGSAFITIYARGLDYVAPANLATKQADFSTHLYIAIFRE